MCFVCSTTQWTCPAIWRQIRTKTSADGYLAQGPLFCSRKPLLYFVNFSPFFRITLATTNTHFSAFAVAGFRRDGRESRAVKIVFSSIGGGEKMKRAIRLRRRDLPLFEKAQTAIARQFLPHRSAKAQSSPPRQRRSLPLLGKGAGFPFSDSLTSKGGRP